MGVQLSVVVATRDRARLLADLLVALDGQVVPQGLAWEIVVVDNGSTDGTPDALAEFAAHTNVPVTRVLEREPGLSRARNRGIAEARGTIIAFTDDDVLPPPDWVTSVAASFARSGADGVGGRILPRWEAPVPAWLADDRRLLSRLSIMDADAPIEIDLPIRGSAQVWGANMAFRRSVFEAVGGFDPRLGMAGTRLFRGEETDLVKRAIRAGFRIVYDPSLVVSHRVGPERMTRSYFRRLFFDAGQSKALVRDLSGRRTLLGAPLRLYRVPLRIGKWAWLSARRRPNAFYRELRWRFQLGELMAHWQRSRARARAPEPVPYPMPAAPPE